MEMKGIFGIQVQTKLVISQTTTDLQLYFRQLIVSFPRVMLYIKEPSSLGKEPLR